MLLRQDDAGAEALTEAREACETLEAVARQAKAERSRADAMQRRETEALLAFEALVSAPLGHLQALKAAIAAAQPHAKTMPDLFGRELAAARDQLAALECAEAADRRELQGLPPPRASALTRAANTAAVAPTSGRDAARKRAEAEERDAKCRMEQTTREEVRQLARRQREQEAKEGAERRAQETLQRECKAAGLAPPPAAKSSNVDSDGYADWW